jgi:hypothetical protein
MQRRLVLERKGRRSVVGRACAFRNDECWLRWSDGGQLGLTGPPT